MAADQAPARVLLLHNRYRAAGGEDWVVDQLAELLRERGHAVARLERDSAEAGRIGAGRAMLRGGVGEGDVGAAVCAHRADVVHAHNVHPLLGWRALAAARAAGARTVLHLHNYRLVCAIGVAYRDGAPCHRCHGRDTRPGVRHGCRGSLAEAAVYAAGIARQQQRLLACADRLVAVSEAQVAVLDTLGVPAARIGLVPNGVSAFAVDSAAAEGRYALFAGRLVEEKGADMAIRAARGAGVPLRIAGAGPEEPRLRALADGADVQFLGRLEPAELARQRRGAAVALVPSRWEEPFGMTALEALADGVPVLASALGGLPALAGQDSVVPAHEEAAWVTALSTLWADPPERARRGAAGLMRARERYGPDAQYAALLRAYEAALA